MMQFSLICDYAQLGDIERMVARFDGQLIHTEFQQNITLHLALPHAQVAGFRQNLSDFSRGALHLASLT
ncbi:hypothetical protein ERHA55_48970 [Erwinia rhapontici]|nr:hypothetical protein ERHA55_48970 [Erwinia rhapontici]